MTIKATSEGTVTTGGGRLHYSVSGAGPPCVVLSGGPGMDGRYMEDVGGLGDFLTLIQVHPRGSGLSVFPDDSDWSLEAFASDVEVVRQELGLGSTILLGHSHGGNIAQRYAIDFPGRASALILVDTAANLSEFLGDVEGAVKGFSDEPWFERAFAAIQREWAEDYSTAEELGSLVADEMYFYFASITPEVESYIGRISKYSANPAPLRAFNKTAMEMDLRPELPSIGCPTLVIVGRHDFITNVSMAEDIARLIPSARLEVFEQSGHFPFVEERERFRSVVGSFIRSLPVG